MVMKKVAKKSQWGLVLNAIYKTRKNQYNTFKHRNKSKNQFHFEKTRRPSDA